MDSFGALTSSSLGSMRLCWLGLAALVLVACVSGPNEPEWLHGRPAAYQDERWVVGVAAAVSPRHAAREAMADIAGQTGGETEGASVVDTWIDPDHDLHWALAVMDRVPLRDEAVERLGKVERQLAGLLTHSNAATPAQALPDVVGALTLLRERAALRTRIAKLGGPPAPDENEVAAELDALERRLAEIKRKLTIEITSYEMDPRSGEIGDPIDQLRRALAEQATGLGFNVRTAAGWGWENDPPWSVVEMRLGFERIEFERRERFVAVHWDAVLSIIDSQGKLVAVVNEEGRSTDMTEGEARRRAREQAEEFGVVALREWLSGQASTDGASAWN